MTINPTKKNAAKKPSLDLHVVVVRDGRPLRSISTGVRHQGCSKWHAIKSVAQFATDRKPDKKSPRFEPAERPNMRLNDVTMPTISDSSAPLPRSDPRMRHMQPR